MRERGYGGRGRARRTYDLGIGPTRACSAAKPSPRKLPNSRTGKLIPRVAGKNDGGSSFPSLPRRFLGSSLFKLRAREVCPPDEGGRGSQSTESVAESFDAPVHFQDWAVQKLERPRLIPSHPSLAPLLNVRRATFLLLCVSLRFPFQSCVCENFDTLLIELRNTGSRILRQRSATLCSR